jgi:SAM-dependent methyltransferase
MHPPENAAGSAPEYEYNEYPKSLPPDDFWGQVRRTRYGKPISDEELAIIVEAIKRALDLRHGDVLLDMACGNGALSSLLFGSCRGFVGVDASEYLIEVAKANFEQLPEFEFVFRDAAQFVWEEPEPLRFTKALCYAGFQYLPRVTAERALVGLSERFTNMDTVVLGNLPDKERAHVFFGSQTGFEDILSEPTSQIGVWWSEDELREFATAAGWQTSITRMPEEIFNANYRFDARLTRS